MAMKRRTVLKAGAALAAATMAPAIVRAETKQWRVAASLPMTGPFATAGQLVAPAFAEFEQQVNDSGGIGGRPIKVEVEDSGYIPRNALANFQRAMAGGDLHFYFGDSTGFMELVGPTLEGDNAVMMGSTSFASSLANPAERPYQFMAGPTYEDQFEILLKDIADKGGKTVAFVYSDTEFGRDPIEHGRKVAADLGIEVVLEEVTKAEGADIENHVTKLAQANPEYTILQGYVTGVWPQLIGGARAFGLQTQFMGTFWGMEKVIADRVTDQAGPFLDGYQGVMPYRYFYDQEDAPFYQQLGAYKKSINPDFPGYVVTWELEGRLNLELWKLCMNRVIEADKPVTPDNLMAELRAIDNWDSGGFFGQPVDVVDHKIGQGRVYRYSADSKLFTPVSDWIQV
ncbi:ABC transporter substrate-binding protein [Saccharospirillum salsuginis]|uniref:Amino acid ABC transporter substrate-binding protein n=1 Tax=Saccharospirillum salsuginis TaxID=418750 RepID=A0A918N675_9GAMM|nr:ABC transporter substrate-binding protein [Saccharospirillum salsuginis]GGX38568.1 amino acid ABC transporter substrate-binding protein [Saccharospirillum salsuginis]